MRQVLSAYSLSLVLRPDVLLAHKNALEDAIRCLNDHVIFNRNMDVFMKWMTSAAQCAQTHEASIHVQSDPKNHPGDLFVNCFSVQAVPSACRLVPSWYLTQQTYWEIKYPTAHWSMKPWIDTWRNMDTHNILADDKSKPKCSPAQNWLFTRAQSSFQNVLPTDGTQAEKGRLSRANYIPVLSVALYSISQASNVFVLCCRQ